MPRIPTKKSGIFVLFVSLVALPLWSGVADHDNWLKEFAKLKRQQTEELAGKLGLDVPAEVREFFHAAEAGDCAAMSNAYARIQQRTGQSTASIQMPGYMNVLNVPVH